MSAADPRGAAQPSWAVMAGLDRAPAASSLERALAGLSVGLGAAAVGLALFVALGKGHPHELGRMMLAFEILPLAAAGAILTAGTALAWCVLARDAATVERARRRALARGDAQPGFGGQAGAAPLSVDAPLVPMTPMPMGNPRPTLADHAPFQPLPPRETAKETS